MKEFENKKNASEKEEKKNSAEKICRLRLRLTVEENFFSFLSFAEFFFVSFCDYFSAMLI